IVIKKNQIIVKEGEPVTAHQLELLNSLGLLNESKFNLYIYISLAIVVLLIVYLQYWYLYKHYKTIYCDFSKLVMISLINIMAIILSRVFSSISLFLIPVICAPILLTLLLNYKLSLIFSILNLILIAGVVGFNPNIITVSLVSIILSATSLRKMQQRNDILYLSIGVAFISSVLCLGISTLSTNNFVEVLVDSLFVAGGAILGGVLAIGVLPFFESTFDVVTTVKLLELSSPNHPLLKKLLMEAPGTYHHSVLVANLAEVATEEIGGNPLLARIGAYYHDVGKTKRPYFFRENQIGKENPHDKISAKLSAHIIISHVKDGVELAKEYNVPKIIREFIATHHGDTLVKYFYLTVKNNSSNPNEVKEEDFKYEGPRPESKEQGVLMLADSVEAAVRSINDPTKEKINQMVNNIIKDKLNSGQLDNCELTLKDIDRIKKCFLKALHGIYHERIEYPTENIKKENS
ncbi:MAG: HD family phosphohydrolase, partial [Sarcina sp.]